jgi:hypothetical protein
MVAGCDAQSGPEVVDNRPGGCGCSEPCIERSNAATDGYDEDESCVDPVDMVVPVTQRNGLLAYMLFLLTWLGFGHCGGGLTVARFV